MFNKLFCTFTTKEGIDPLVNQIKSTYRILFDKIFLFTSDLESEEYICTYNVDFGNVSKFLDNTILVHRKKETNTLYTINALNEVVKQENGGRLDRNYKIDWEKYRDCVLLTREAKLTRINTKLYDILKI